jgi:hypothetical protein
MAIDDGLVSKDRRRNVLPNRPMQWTALSRRR